MENKQWVKPDSIELPIEKNPPIKTYLHHAFPLSVMYTNENYKTFYHSNYLQLVYNQSSGCAYDFHEFQYRHLPYFYCDRLDDSMTKQIKRDINEFITMQIVNRYYCAAWVDAFYIPGEMYYNKQHITHGILIYKYDDIKREYTALAYTNQNTTYNEIVVPYDSFTASYNSEFFSMLDFYKINFGLRPTFDEKSIRKKLEAYIHSENYDLDDVKANPQVAITLYGRDVCISLCDYFKERQKTLSTIDLRYVRILVEHKNSLIDTLSLLKTTADIDKICFINNSIKKLCENLLLWAIKYNVSLSPEAAKMVIVSTSKILDLERELLLLYDIQ